MKTNPIVVGRIRNCVEDTNPVEGRVVWSPVKSLWFTGHLAIAIVGGWATWHWAAPVVACSFAALTACLGGVGVHRLLVHRSFKCPRWLEYLLVHFGTLMGVGGPWHLIHHHDLRDWAQRHPACHPFFSDRSPVWKDFLWQIHGKMRLKRPPSFELESGVADDPVYRFMQRTWMLQQLPWALLCYWVAGIAGVVWGISVRIVVSLTSHWFVGWLAHNMGQRDWHLEGHAVQGYNLPHAGLITMGEGWHNNHHAFPESARLGLRAGQWDPGWWFICLLRACGLAWDIRDPANLPNRPERHALPRRGRPKLRASTSFEGWML